MIQYEKYLKRINLNRYFFKLGIINQNRKVKEDKRLFKEGGKNSSKYKSRIDKIQSKVFKLIGKGQ